MNVRLDSVIANITGLTGQRILRAIVDGERDPERLAALRHRRVKADSDTIAASLQGTRREEHLFALEQATQRYDLPRRSALHQTHVPINTQASACCMITDRVGAERFAVAARPAMFAFDGSDGSQSDLVVSHLGVFPAGRGVLRRVEWPRGSASREARGAPRGERVARERAGGAGSEAGCAGDFCSEGEAVEARSFGDFFRGLPHRHKVVIVGNHDRCLEADPGLGPEIFAGCHYLLDSGAEIEGVTFWDSPW